MKHATDGYFRRVVFVGTLACIGCGSRTLPGESVENVESFDASLQDAAGPPAHDAGVADVTADDGTGDAQARLDGPCGQRSDTCCADSSCTSSLVCIEGRCVARIMDAAADGSTCSSTSPCTTTLATDQFMPNSIAVDSVDVYWTNQGRGSFGSVVSVSLSGGLPQTLVSGRVSPATIAVDSSSVYWCDYGAALLRASLNGGAVSTLATGSVEATAVDSTSVYWSDSNVGVRKMAKAIGVAETLAPGLIGPPFGFALDATYVYWTDFTYHELTKVPKAGGAVVSLAFTQGESLAVGASSVYWNQDGTVSSVGIDGGTPQTLATERPASGVVAAIAVDDLNVYWTYFGSGTAGVSDGAILRVPRVGGSVVTLASGEASPTAVALDSTSVYWTTASEVRKRTPK